MFSVDANDASLRQTEKREKQNHCPLSSVVISLVLTSYTPRVPHLPPPLSNQGGGPLRERGPVPLTTLILMAMTITNTCYSSSQ